MDESRAGECSSATETESIESSTNVMSSSENVNNENREKELLLEGARTADVESITVTDKESTSLDMVEENKSNENRDNNDREDDKYAKHVEYNAEGIAIYTDPETKYKYKWSEEKSEWIPADVDADVNPYENEHYRWCNETKQWIPKTDTSSADGKTENEFYRWDEITKQWIPKTQSSDVTSNFKDGVHTYMDKDGMEYFWDTDKNAWFPKIDDEFMARYQMNYGFIDNTSTKTTTDDSKKEEDDSAKGSTSEKLSEDQQPEASGSGLKRKVPSEPPKWFDIPPEHNTKVYVSHLPLDITEEEFVQVMSKCGLIMRDPKTQKFKVKLYAEADGQLKGDGLCDYIKIESVDLALNLLDGYDVRGQKINVQRATFQMRGEYNPALKPKKKKKDKEKILKMKEKLFDWRPEKMRGERSKHERCVVVKNLFTPELFDKEVHLIIDYQKDLREECGKCGTVRKVVLYDRHPEGVAQITMADPDEADLVVQMMDGRFFGKRKLTAEIWDGKTKFKIGETDAEVQQRLTNWDQYLETDEKKLLETSKEKPTTETEDT